MGRVLYRRSRTDYPRGVIGIYDNAGQRNETADRYLVVFDPIVHDSPEMRSYYGRETFPILSMSGSPYHPQGICMHGETPFRPTGGWQSGPNSAGRTINFADLPADCQRAVKQDLLPCCEQCGCCGSEGGHYEYCTVETPFTVGIVETCRRLGRFESEELASAFIETLEGFEDGRYYLDGPER